MSADELPAAPTSADDLDRQLLDHLQEAVTKASETCFELKKLCAAILVPVGTLISLFSGKRLDPAMFGAAVALIAGFWLADAVAFFYQRKLRARMTTIWRERGRRLQPEWKNYQNVQAYNWARSAFNSSMIFYWILLGLVIMAWILLSAGVIHASTVSS